MAKLSRLRICGIRSFGPRDEDLQDISFSTPVTLILGENGCGKTTIIEALRYACTGVSPEGTNSGRGFLQDPKLSNSSTVKGFVKLRINDTKGNTIIINRGAKVELLRSGKLKYEKLDSTIKTAKSDGEEVTLSGRCADIGEQVYHLMGISKPIIDNVIFCHQEQSLWPLDEDSQVKKKFDEIFDATKYNKCIDDFRKFYKNEKQTLKNLNELLGFKKEKKEWVEKKRGALYEDESKLSELVTNINRKENEIKPINNEINRICELETTLVQLRGKLIAKETEQNTIFDNRKAILAKLIEEFNGSDEELNKAIHNFEENKTKNNVKIANTELEMKEIEEKFRKINIQIQKTQVRIGQLETEKKQQQEKIDERNKQLEVLAKQLKVVIKHNTDGEVGAAVETIRNAIKNLQITLNNEHKSKQLDEKNQQEIIDKHRESIAKLEQEKALNLTQRKDAQDKQRDTNSQLKQLAASDLQLNQINNEICRLDREIKCLLDSYDPKEIEKRIGNTREEIESSEKKLLSLEEDYTILQKNYVTEESITTRTSDLMKKEGKIYEIKASRYQQLKSLCGEVPEKNFKVTVEKYSRQNTNELDEIKIKIDNEKQKITHNEALIRVNEEKLESYERKVLETNQKIAEITQGNSFDEVCLKLERSTEKLQKTRGQLSSAKIIYEKFVKDFQSEKPCCPICETDFTDKRSVASRIVAKIKRQIDDLPQELERKEHELKKEQELFNQTQQLKPLYDEAKELEATSIPHLKSEIDDAKEIVRVAKDNLKELNEKIQKPKQLKEIADKILGDATLLDKYNSEVDSFRNEIDNLKTKLLPSNTDKSKELVDREIKVCRTNLTDMRKSCDLDVNKLAKNRKEYQDLRDAKTDEEKKKLNLEKSMHGKPQLLDQLVALGEEEQRLEYEIKNLEEKLIPLREILDKAKNDLELSKTENDAKHQKSMEECNRMEVAFESIIKNQRAIEAFAHKKIEDQLISILEDFKTFKRDEETLSINKKDLSEAIVQLKEDQAKAEMRKRNLEDNVDIRKKTKEIEALQESIKSLKDEIGNENHTTLQNTKQQLQRQAMTLIKEINNMKGQKEQLEDKIKSEKTDLEKPENKGAYNIYKRALFELEVRTQSVSDAEIYCKRLEKAIIQFHAEKMSNINRTIRELWRSVYRGNDIDYIQIKTEQPEGSATRRTYNYRVVQIKNDVEIDMRGRCSAGQKVLACLLIRMALALTFSHNCGILALDEPTTNLDRENIHSLCETLANMIQSRRTEKNFQLLIITHDEDFIKSLSQAESIDHCLRVSRNKYGNTVISREYIN